jgi:hypothetical protein
MSNDGDDFASSKGGGGWWSRMSRSEHIVAALIGATITGIFGIIVAVIASSSGSSHSSPPGTASSSPAPPTTGTPPSSKSSPKLKISVVCRIPPRIHEGEQITAIYTITSNQSVKVGLGAGVYDSGRTDHSNGTGDKDGYQLAVGTQKVTRILVLPSGLSTDQYEIDAEIWPTDKIGADGVEVLAEATCGLFKVS